MLIMELVIVVRLVFFWGKSDNILHSQFMITSRDTRWGCFLWSWERPSTCPPSPLLSTMAALIGNAKEKGAIRKQRFPCDGREYHCSENLLDGLGAPRIDRKLSIMPVAVVSTLVWWTVRVR